MLPPSLENSFRQVWEQVHWTLRVVPGLLTSLASQLGAVRHTAAQRLIRQATLLGMAVSVEPLPLLDLPLLVGIQLRLLAQLGTLYGKRMSRADDWQTVLAVQRYYKRKTSGRLRALSIWTIWDRVAQRVICATSAKMGHGVG